MHSEETVHTAELCLKSVDTGPLELADIRLDLVSRYNADQDASSERGPPLQVCL
jgi:hypothetical protein